MKNQIRTCLKTAWLAAAIAIFFMGTSMCVSTTNTCSEAGRTMFGLMILITFPTGVFFFLVSLIFINGIIYDPADFATGWFIMMCGGLLQWFVIAPGLFEKPAFTTLNLKTPELFPRSQNSNPKFSRKQITPADAIKNPIEFSRDSLIPSADPDGIDLRLPLGSPTPAPSPTVHVPATRTKAQRKAIKSIAAFDRRGRTPLERVLKRL